MKISESTIADIVKRGDSSTIYEIIRRLIANLNQGNSHLHELRRNHEKLKELFTTTELDRDRFRMVAKELTELCEQNGLSQAAAEITHRHGGLGEPQSDIAIDLE